MRDIRLAYTDHELFDTLLGSEEYSYLITHIDALKRMWNEQGKSFWLKYLVMYRHYCYTVGTVYSMKKDRQNSIPLCIHRLFILADQLFIVLHNEFINCRYSSAKQFIDDLATLMSNRGLLFLTRNSSISHNPFYAYDTRDAFRKLLGHCINFPPGLKELYYMGLGVPILGIFGGGIFHLLKRWINAPIISISSEEYLRLCWTPPPEFSKPSTFAPMSFHRHLLEKHSIEIDSLLYNGSFGFFSSSRITSKDLLTEGSNKIGAVKSTCCGCDFKTNDSSHHLYESFVEFICQRQVYLPSTKYDTEELRLDFEDFLKEKVEDFECEEYRRSKILKLAEKKFQEELEQEKKLVAKGKNKNEKVKVISASYTMGTDSETDLFNPFPKFKMSGRIISKSEAQDICKKVLSAQTVSKGQVRNVNDSAKIPKPKTVNDKGQDQKHSKSIGTDPVHKNAEPQVCFHESIGVNSKPISIEKVSQISEKSVPNTSTQSLENGKATGNKKSRKKNKKIKEEILESLPNNSTKTDNTSSSYKPNCMNKNVMKSKKESDVKSTKSASVTNSSINSDKNSNVNPKCAKDTKTENQIKAQSKSLPKKENKQDRKENSKQSISSELRTISKNIDSIEKAVKETNKMLQSCANCFKVEENPKTFKKCARCKSESIMWVKFYCSRECQVANWLECHQEEHDKGTLPRK